MSVSCGDDGVGCLDCLRCGVCGLALDCLVILGCSRWVWKRCTYVGSDDNAAWAPATPYEFEPIPRVCCLILAVYRPDIRHPEFPTSGGYSL